MPVPARRLPSGTIMVDTAETAVQGQVVVYARVSSADQKADLDRQVARVTQGATGQQLAVSRVVTEVGSALNGRSKKVLGLLRAPGEIGDGCGPIGHAPHPREITRRG